MHPFLKTDLLLPQVAEMEKWAVIACDQFVSQPEYWAEADRFVGSAPSALRLILPEAMLEENCSGRIDTINQTMHRYLQENLFRQYPDCFVYVERTLHNGSIRKGVMGALDLTQYDFHPDSRAAVRATEETVAERVPPRMEIRQNAMLELPHVLLLCDDSECLLIESLSKKREQLPLLYDFQLMAGGGRIRGWLVSGEDEKAFTAEIEAYENRIKAKYGENAVLYAVGDGNHSIAAAKACYGADPENPAGRYALVELENIHDDAQVFQPIHRIVKQTDPEALLQAMENAIGAPHGQPVHWVAGDRSGTLTIGVQKGQLAVGVVQDFLDEYLAHHPGTPDYIHGQADVKQLAQLPDTVGFLLPPVAKDDFFQTILYGGTLPRKTFSMGHAREKRYYLEARKIR